MVDFDSQAPKGSRGSWSLLPEVQTETSTKLRLPCLPCLPCLLFPCFSSIYFNMFNAMWNAMQCNLEMLKIFEGYCSTL